MSSKLIIHRDAVKISKQDHYAIQPPRATETFKPIKHSDLIDLLGDQLRSRGLVIKWEEYAVQGEGYLLSASWTSHGRNPMLIPPLWEYERQMINRLLFISLAAVM
jgi:hypothetical protein